MNRYTHQESLSQGDDYVDVDGDVHHLDDNPEGFDAQGFDPHGSNTRHEVSQPEDDPYYDEMAETDYGVNAVNLNFHREQSYLARKSYAKARRSAGLELKLAHDIERDLTLIEKRRRQYFNDGEKYFKEAFGYEVMRAAALAEGEDMDAFEHEYKLARNEFIRSNDGRKGEVARRGLRRIIRNSNSPTKHSIEE